MVESTVRHLYPTSAAGLLHLPVVVCQAGNTYRSFPTLQDWKWEGAHFQKSTFHSVPSPGLCYSSKCQAELSRWYSLTVGIPRITTNKTGLKIIKGHILWRVENGENTDLVRTVSRVEFYQSTAVEIPCQLKRNKNC